MEYGFLTTSTGMPTCYYRLFSFFLLKISTTGFFAWKMWCYFAAKMPLCITVRWCICWCIRWCIRWCISWCIRWCIRLIEYMMVFEKNENIWYKSDENPLFGSRSQTYTYFCCDTCFVSNVLNTHISWESVYQGRRTSMGWNGVGMGWKWWRYFFDPRRSRGGKNMWPFAGDFAQIFRFRARDFLVFDFFVGILKPSTKLKTEKCNLIL